MRVQSHCAAIEGIPLAQLFLAPLNVRKGDADKKIAELADSIQAEGVLQSLAGYEEDAVCTKRFKAPVHRRDRGRSPAVGGAVAVGARRNRRGLRGRHERMHLTLKKEATKPPAKNFLQQQGKFDQFMDCYNNQRPPSGSQHEVPRRTL